MSFGNTTRFRDDADFWVWLGSELTLRRTNFRTTPNTHKVRRHAYPTIVSLDQPTGMVLHGESQPKGCFTTHCTFKVEVMVCA